MQLCMKHQRPKPFIICSNDPGLTLTYFMARLNFTTYVFIMEKNVTMMDSLDIISSCDLKLG